MDPKKNTEQPVVPEVMVQMTSVVCDGETIQDVIDSMNEKQKNVMYYLVATAREENKEDSTMAHNAWDVQFSCRT